MPFDRPTLPQLIARLESDLESRLEVAIIRRSVEAVLARVLAGAAHGLHGHLAWVAEQLLPDRAESAAVLRWARMLGTGLLPAEPSEGGVVFTSTSSVVIPEGTVMLREDGAEYVATSDGVAVSDELAAVFVRSVEVGVGTLVPTGTPMSLQTPVPGIVAGSGVVADPGLLGGRDPELVEELRARVLQQLDQRVRGGGPGDYVVWALEGGAGRAWEVAKPDGEVDVIVVERDPMTGGPSGLGSEGIARVNDVVQANAPITVLVTVLGANLTGVPLTFTSLTPDTPEVREAVELELHSMFWRESTPGGAIPISKIREAISAAEGEEDFTLSTPTADIPADEDKYYVLGTVTWPA